MLGVLSIIVEIIIVIVSLKLAFSKKKIYGYGLALTFGIYVLYDSIRQFDLEVSPLAAELLFAVASFSALWSVWTIYKGKK